MASLRRVTDRGRDGWLIRFYLQGKRKGISLSGLRDSDAERWREHVDDLVACHGRRPPSKATTLWLSTLDHSDRQKLENAGLIEPAETAATADASPEVVLVGDYLRQYAETVLTDAKPSTMIFYQQTLDRLAEYFQGREIASITPPEAREFRRWLEASSNKRDKPADDGRPKPLASNTVRRRMGVCKRIFSQAVTDGLIAKNPFQGMVSTVRSNKDRQAYVDLETFAKVMAAAPSRQWRCLLVLARLLGVRMPSEVAGLRWVT